MNFDSEQLGSLFSRGELSAPFSWEGPEFSDQALP